LLGKKLTFLAITSHLQAYKMQGDRTKSKFDLHSFELIQHLY